MSPSRGFELTGGLAALGISVALFTRFGLGDTLKRDESIYVYAGQQLTHGVAPYDGIFDPKPPLAGMLAGLAAWVGGLVGVGDLTAIRLAYFAFSCLTVLAVYVLCLWLWRPVVAALVGAIVFATFRGFAMDALAGPNAKTPGIAFGVMSMALVVRQRWFSAALLGSVAFLVWQPLGIYAAVTVLSAALVPPAGERRRAIGQAVAGAAVPIAVLTAYLAIVGALGRMLDAAFVFPATGVKRGPETVVQRLDHIASVIRLGYLHTWQLFWLGTVLLLIVVTVHLVAGRGPNRERLGSPLVAAVLVSMAALWAFSAKDFQGYPDLYPLLPYAALGFAGATSLVVTHLSVPVLRTVATAGALACVLALSLLSFGWLGQDKAADGGLAAQRDSACALNRLLEPGESLVSLGDPTVFVLTHRRSPTRYIYLNSGVGGWEFARTKGGYLGWRRQLLASQPSAIALHGWKSKAARRTAAWLHQVYDPAYLGGLRVYLAPGVRARAQRLGIRLDGQRLPRRPASRC